MAAAARKIPASPATDVEKATAAVEAAQAVVTDLEQRLIAAQAKLDGFAPARARHSFTASQGDSGARAALDALAADQRAVEHEVNDLTEARDEARRRRDAAQAELAVAGDQARLAAAQDDGRRYIEVCRKVDRILADLVAAAAEEREIAAELERTRTLPPAVALQLADVAGSYMNSAMRYAGAHRIYTGNREASTIGDGPLVNHAEHITSRIMSPAAVAKMRPLMG
jgi:chromosome segregation ATPase